MEREMGAAAQAPSCQSARAPARGKGWGQKQWAHFGSPKAPCFQPPQFSAGLHHWQWERGITGIPVPGGGYQSSCSSSAGQRYSWTSACPPADPFDQRPANNGKLQLGVVLHGLSLFLGLQTSLGQWILQIKWTQRLILSFTQALVDPKTGTFWFGNCGKGS